MHLEDTYPDRLCTPNNPADDNLPTWAAGLYITGLRSIYVRGQMIIKGGGGSRGVIQRQAGSETARSSRLNIWF